MLGKKLTIQHTALEHVAQFALNLGTGARGIRAILKEILEDAMFTAPDDETTTRYTITKSTVEKYYKSTLEATA